jgi:hypothetical protein
VIVFSSADPEFFIAHVDMHIWEEMDVLQELAASAPADVNVFQAIGELIRHQPQVIILKLAGKARAGGAELVAPADMTFAAIETAGLGQIEALMGISPGGGGTQYLRDRVGRNRALEVILTADLAMPRLQRPTDGSTGPCRPASSTSTSTESPVTSPRCPTVSSKQPSKNDAWAFTFSRPAARHLIRTAPQSSCSSISH